MTEVEKAVHKATNSKQIAPKRKHVRTIIIESWNENSARSFFTEIAKRPFDTSDLVCFKGLTTTHKVIQEGPRQALIDSYYRLQWIDSIRDHWNRAVESRYSRLSSEYCLFLRDKISFHHRHNEFDGDISLEKFLKLHKIDSFELEKCIDIVSHLLDLQESVFKLETAIVAGRDLSDVKSGALIPLVLESYAIYTTITHFLMKMVDRVDSIDVLQFLIERYYAQYMTLREFYINANAIRAVSSVIAVPNLPPDPPKFATRAREKPRARKSPSVPRRAGLNSPAPASRTAELPSFRNSSTLQIPQNSYDLVRPPGSSYATAPSNAATVPTQSFVVPTNPYTTAPSHLPAPAPAPAPVPVPTHASVFTPSSAPAPAPAPVSVAPTATTYQYAPPVSQNAPLPAAVGWTPFTHGPMQPQQQQQQHPQHPPMPTHNLQTYTTSAPPQANVQPIVTSVVKPPAAPAAPQWVTFQSGTPEPVRRAPADPFSNLLSIAKNDVVTGRPRANTQPDEKSAEAVRATLAELMVTPPPPSIPVPTPTPAPTPMPVPAPAAVPTPRAATVTDITPPVAQVATTTSTSATPTQAVVGDGKPRVVTKIITKTVNNTAELNKLKARIEEMEAELARERDMNSALSARLAEREAALQGTEAAVHQLQEAYEGANGKVVELEKELEEVLDKQHEARWKSAVVEISAGKDAVEMSLAQLDSPMNLGNQEATAAIVVEQAGIVSQVASRLLQVCDGFADESMEQDELYSAVSAVSGALKSLFTNAKGASRLVEDQQASQSLLENTRQVGIHSAALLETVRALGGQPQDEEDRKALRDRLNLVLQSVNGVVGSSKTMEEIQQRQQQQPQQQAEIDQSGIDLDDLANRELLAAAKIIEDAANTLLAAKAKKPPKEPSDNRPDVAEAILEAAMAITNATSTLVASASSAQRERAEKGRAIVATGVPYRRDPTWAEGLISAAKAVAQATSALVGVANDAIQNKDVLGGEERLIAVSKAVAAATSQLVAAARAKSDTIAFATQEKLNVAARSVSHATSLLVAAARAAAAKDETEDEEDYSKMSATGYKVKEMEQTMQILRLEKELEKARKGLLVMRKSEYAK